MRIVLGLHGFAQFAGTETYTLTVAEELQELADEVVVHAGTAGEIAAVARRRGIAVTTGPRGLPGTCDAVLAQDAGSAFALASAYPDAYRAIVVHSDYHALQAPPQLAGVCDAAIVLNDRIAARLAALAATPPVVRLRQPVDLKRFGVSGGRSAAGTGRVLVLGNYLRGPALDTVVEACEAAGLEPVVNGVHTTTHVAVEDAIAGVDVVLGLGRCVVEAMAGRRAAYVYGIAGGDGWVTAETYAALEADGFGGTATGEVVGGDRLRADLAAWEPGMGAVNRQLAVGHDAARHGEALVSVLRGDAPAAVAAPVGRGAELARLVRLEHRTWGRYAAALDGQRLLREAGEERRAELAAVRSELAAAIRERDEALAALAAFRATRRYRLAAVLAAPFDRLRGHSPCR